MYINTSPQPLPTEGAFYALFIVDANRDIVEIIATARTGRAVKRHVDNGTEVFSVVFVADGDNRVIALSEEQLRDELIRRRRDVCDTHW